MMTHSRYGFVVLVLICFLLGIGCASESGDSANDTLTFCTLDPALDEATQRAVFTIQTQLDHDIWPDQAPNGLFSAQRALAHETIHAVTRRIDHVETPGNLMHAKHAPRQRVFGPEDKAYVGNRRRVAYTRNMGACDVAVQWGEIGRATGLWCPKKAEDPRCPGEESILLNTAYDYHLP